MRIRDAERTNMIDLVTTPINTIMMDMEIGIEEQVCRNTDGSYTVFLNARYDHETLEKAYTHALEHIRNDDWQHENVQLIEAEAHETEKKAKRKLKKLTEQEKEERARKRRERAAERRAEERNQRKRDRAYKLYGVLDYNQWVVDRRRELWLDPDSDLPRRW